MALVLIADDNPLSLRFMVEALASLDCDCVAAEDGVAAVRHASAAAFDLLVLDARMPGYDGVEVLQRVRTATGPSADAAAIATTAADNVDATSSLRDAGFADVLLKPIAVAALRDAVARHLPARPDPAELDDAQARLAAGGDLAIVHSLRSLFAAELEALPAELARIRRDADRTALRDRLHRLDASAGFCGAAALASAIRNLRGVAGSTSWPDAAVGQLLEVAERTRRRISG